MIGEPPSDAEPVQSSRISPDDSGVAVRVGGADGRPTTITRTLTGDVTVPHPTLLYAASLNWYVAPGVSPEINTDRALPVPAEPPAQLAPPFDER